MHVGEERRELEVCDEVDFHLRSTLLEVMHSFIA